MRKGLLLFIVIGSFLDMTPILGKTEAAFSFDQIKQDVVLRDQVFKQDLKALTYHSYLIDIWNRIVGEHLSLTQSGKLLAFSSLIMGEGVSSSEGLLGINSYKGGGFSNAINHEAFLERLQQWENQGYRVESMDWHLVKFNKNQNGQFESSYTFELYIKNSGTRRITVLGECNLTWATQKNRKGQYIPKDIKLTSWDYFVRSLPPLFQLEETIPITGRQSVICTDVNNDHYSDIVLPGNNEIWLFQKGKGYKKTHLFPENVYDQLYGQARMVIGAVADFSNNGVLDLMIVAKNTDVSIFEGDGDGGFLSTPRVVFDKTFERPSAIAVGDVDGDGRLDIFIGQNGEENNITWDTFDNYNHNFRSPSYLLLNRGLGTFVDATLDFGLQGSRSQKIYSASFVDLNGDQLLDLLVSSDFSGVDLYFNQDNDRFIRGTERQIKGSSKLFGMGHTFTDLNQDGQLDFFVTGMVSATAKRLLDMGYYSQKKDRILSMTYGNRAFISSGNRFVQPKALRSLSKSPWAWGTTSLDIDNNGSSELFIATGFISNSSMEDYCPVAWRQDFYVQEKWGEKGIHALRKAYLKKGLSWEGHKRNQLFVKMNMVDGERYLDVAYLLGVGSVLDSRMVISDDSDLDGYMDLWVLELDSPKTKDAYNKDEFHALKTLKLYRHTGLGKGDYNWIGLRLQGHDRLRTPFGTNVVIKAGNDVFTEAWVTGDSLYSQHSLTKHIGLGEHKTVDTLTISWPNGQQEELVNLQSGRYYDIIQSRSLLSVIKGWFASL